MDQVLVYPDPLGVVLIMGAWNYPIQLPLLPLAAAIAAGNVAIVKPSEIAVKSANIIAEMMPKYLDNVSRVMRVKYGLGNQLSQCLVQNRLPV